MQKKIQRPLIRQFDSLNFAFADAFEVLLNGLGRYLSNKEGIKLFMQRYQANIGGITLVT